ncbi:MAG: hypothetical protein HY974_03650 [Candidatus Kerfeldbacteria bacterium]|nr:hypothetical protein [Candidatus Kerfeldbacteria bacterium]
MRQEILGRKVEGDEHGVYYLDELDAEAEELFHKAKYEHRAEFKDHDGRHYVLTRESAGRYLVAHSDNSSGWA